MSKFGDLKKLRESRVEETSEHSDTQESQRLDVQVPDEPAGRGGKSSNPGFQRTTVYVEKKLLKRVKVLLLSDLEDRDVSDLVNELLEVWASKGT